MIERRLEGLVLDEQPLTGVDIRVERPQVLLEPLLPVADVRGAGIVRSVGEPQHDIAAVQPSRDGDAVARVPQRVFAHGPVGIAERAELVHLVFEEVRVDRARLDAVLRRKRYDPIDIVQAARQIPQHVQRQRRTHARELVDLLRVGEFLVDGRGGGRLQILAETGSGIGEPP